jgi:hypothetical protein
MHFCLIEFYLVAIIPNRQTTLRSVHKISSNFQLNYNSNSRRNEHETYWNQGYVNSIRLPWLISELEMCNISINLDKESLVFVSAIPCAKEQRVTSRGKKNLLYIAYVLCLIYLLLRAKFSLILQIMLEDRFSLSYITFILCNFKIKNRRFVSVRLTKMFQMWREDTVYLWAPVAR